MQARPPETTDARTPASAATVPDSTSPSRGPLVTTSEKTDDMRPRIASGVTVWLIDRAADGADAVGRAGDREQRGRERRSSPPAPASRDRRAPHDDRGDHDPAQAPRVREPAGGQRGDRRAGRDGGEEQPGPLAPAW